MRSGCTQKLIQGLSRKSSIGILFFFFLLLASYLLPLFLSHSPYTIYEHSILSTPSRRFLLGTDELGRDILSRLLIAVRNSISVSFGTALLSACVGTLLALVSVSFHKIFSALITFVCDAILCVPILLLCLVAAASFGGGIKVVILGELVAFVPFVFRLARKELDFVLSQEFSNVSYRMGMHPLLVAIKDGMPFLAPKLAAQSISLCAIAMEIEGGLSYFGLGFTLPEPSLGLLLQQAKNYIQVAPLYSLAPIAIFFLFLLIFSWTNMAMEDNTTFAERRTFSPRNTSRIT